MLTESVIHAILKHCPPFEIPQLRETFAAEIPLELKAELLQYFVNWSRDFCEKYLRENSEDLIKKMEEK